MDNSVETTAVLPAGSWYSMFNVAVGQAENFEMSCIMGYEGMGTTYENYPLAKGIDENNFVGATSYNSKIMLYEKVGGAWHNLNVNVSAAGTLGKEVKIVIIGNQITLYVDHVEIGTAIHGVPGLAYAGSMLRRHPIVGLLWRNLKIKNLGETGEIVTHNGEYVTHNGEYITMAELADILNSGDIESIVLGGTADETTVPNDALYRLGEQLKHKQSDGTEMIIMENPDV
jgi:hypothetical protein